MLLGSKTATNNQEERTRLHLFWRLFFPCCGPVTAPVIHLFFFREMPILWAFLAEQRSNLLFFTVDEAKNARDANGSCIFGNWRVEKGHRPAPARRQNKPGDSSVMGGCKATIMQL